MLVLGPSGPNRFFHAHQKSALLRFARCIYAKARVSGVQEAWVHHSSLELIAQTCCQQPNASGTHVPVGYSQKLRFKSLASLRSPALP